MRVRSYTRVTCHRARALDTIPVTAPRVRPEHVTRSRVQEGRVRLFLREIAVTSGCVRPSSRGRRKRKKNCQSSERRLRDKSAHIHPRDLSSRERFIYYIIYLT